MIGPLVSIIIPTFNRGSMISQTLNSVCSQTYTNWECLVIDDGSTDNTQQVVSTFTAKDQRIKYCQRNQAKQKGANSCRNEGLEKANGEFIKWLDSDDLLNEHCLRKQLAVLQSHNGDVNFCQADYFIEENGVIKTVNGLVWGKLKPKDDNKVLEAFFFEGVRWSTPCGLWRRSFLPKEPFKEGLQNSQEWLMHLYMILLKPKFSFIDESLCHVRKHNDSMSHASKKGGRYYFHQCIARIEALELLSTFQALENKIYYKIVRFIFWNHLFVFYKRAPLHGVKLLSRYPKLLIFGLSANRSLKHEV